jgi:hypothetical protein
VLQFDARLRANERAPGGCALVRVVVDLVARDRSRFSRRGAVGHGLHPAVQSVGPVVPLSAHDPFWRRHGFERFVRRTANRRRASGIARRRRLTRVSVQRQPQPSPGTPADRLSDPCGPLEAPHLV